MGNAPVERPTVRKEREMNTRQRVKRILEQDPEGRWSDLAIAAELGVTEGAISYHRRAMGVPSAQARRRKAPGARVGICEPCEKSYMVRPTRMSVLCTSCGEWLSVQVTE
jgi:hypothetical protein